MEAQSHPLQSFPFLQSPDLENEIMSNSTIVHYKAGDVIVREGQYLKILPLVMSGSLRVFQQSDEREILLYYVQPGETCVMSLTSCFFNTKSPSQAVAETDAEVLCVPAKFIKEWQRTYDQWNVFVINTFQSRYNELLNLFNEVVFNNIEERLAAYLNSYVSRHGVNVIPVTHLELANELGTTRVVVSRILKRFEQDGRIELLRGSIKINKT